MIVLPVKAKRRDKNCSGRHSRGLRSQNWEHLVNLCESNILQKQVIFPIQGQNFISVLPGESTNDIEIKITHHRVIGNGCIWEIISLTNACRLSQQLLYQVLNAVSDVLKKV